MSDIAFPEVSIWQTLESRARDLLKLYGYREVRTPVVEKQSVFVHSLGDTTDIVQKEMYKFEDGGGRQLVLRPEGTAGVIRYIAGIGQDGANARVFYMGPMFRRERPQAGRKRQFHQFGIEAVSEPNPHIDAEIIAMQAHLLRAWGLNNFTIRINTRGVAADRDSVQQALTELLQPRADELCDDCRRRMATNIFRVLDCKNKKCRSIINELPPVTDFMAEETRQYLTNVLQVIEKLDIEVTVDPTLVRGLDYYEHTVWEIAHAGLGAQDALSGGGRYRITQGKRTVAGVGFGMGLERVIMALEAEQGEIKPEPYPLVYIISLDKQFLDDHLQLAQALRMRGIACSVDLTGRSVKAQMRAAGNAGARWVVLHGEEEQEKGIFQLKDMDTGTQIEVDMPDLLERLKQAVIYPLA